MPTAMNVPNTLPPEKCNVISQWLVHRKRYLHTVGCYPSKSNQLAWAGLRSGPRAGNAKQGTRAWSIEMRAQCSDHG
jgi:hypothetical protein